MMTDDDKPSEQQVDHLLLILQREFWSGPLPEEIKRLTEQLKLCLQTAIKGQL